MVRKGAREQREEKEGMRLLPSPSPTPGLVMTKKRRTQSQNCAKSTPP